MVAVSEAGDPFYGFLSTPLIAADQAATAAPALIRALRASRELPLVMQRLATSGAFFDAVGSALETRSVRTLEDTRFQRALLLRSDGDPFAHMRPHHRRDLKRMGRRLAEDLDGELETHDRAGEQAAVDRFLELELGGWKGRAGTAFASTPGHAAFFRELCERYHRAGRLQLLELGTSERLVASKCNLLAGGGTFAFKIAFDEVVLSLVARTSARGVRTSCGSTAPTCAGWTRAPTPPTR